jgi:hypothetical protein
MGQKSRVPLDMSGRTRQWKDSVGVNSRKRSKTLGNGWYLMRMRAGDLEHATMGIRTRKWSKTGAVCYKHVAGSKIRRQCAVAVESGSEWLLLDENAFLEQ